MDQPDSSYIYDIVKVELDEDSVSNENFLNINDDILSDVNLPDLTFLLSEVTTDPIAGQSVCLLCFEEMQPEAVTAHMVNIHKYRRISLKCFTCGQYFQEKNLLQIHKQACQPKKTIKRPSLQQLINQAHDQYHNKRMCPICLWEVKDDLKEHLEKNHTRIVEARQRAAAQQAAMNAKPANCPICGKLFKSRITMNGHVKLVHESKQDSVQCEYCDQTFSSVKYKTNHVRNVHPLGRQHECEYCHKHYKSHQSLYQHVKYVHRVKLKRRSVDTDTTAYDDDN